MSCGRAWPRATRVQREYGFAFPLGGGCDVVTMNGFVDILAEEADGGALLVDYKSDRLEPGADLEAYVEDGYAVQRRLYALAALRAGAPAGRGASMRCSTGPPSRCASTYTAEDVPTLERDLLDLAAGPLGGDYRVSAGAAPRAVRDVPGAAGDVLVAGGDDAARDSRRFVAEAMK